MSDKNLTPSELFDRVSAAGDRIRTVAREAEDVFWEALAKSLPECRSGDFPPDAARKFQKACEEAAAEWFGWNKPQRWDGDGDGLADWEEALPDINGWGSSYEHPGYIAWRWTQGGHPCEVQATPDWDSAPGDDGVIALAVVCDGAEVDSAEIPWPFEGRTVEDYRNLIAPYLDKHAPRRVASCELRVEMRPAKRGEIGYYVRTADAVKALDEVIAEARKEGEIGWIAETDTSPWPDDGLVPVTISLVRS